jgi:hypothetical protein
VSRRASISGIVDQADVTQPFCPRSSAHATIPFRQSQKDGAHGRLPGNLPGKMALSAENMGNFL